MGEVGERTSASQGLESPHCPGPRGVSGPWTAHPPSILLPGTLSLLSVWAYTTYPAAMCPFSPLCSFVNSSYLRAQLTRPLLADSSLCPCCLCNNSFGCLFTRQPRMLSAWLWGTFGFDEKSTSRSSWRSSDSRMFNSSDSGGDDGFSSHHAVGEQPSEVSWFAQGRTVM